jgi:PPP family 3-phenylpropionic acid transporter
LLKTNETVAIRLSYFLYLGAIGVIFTYWPLHFKALGLRADEIGWIFSGRAVVSLLMQPVIGWLAVRYGRPAGVLRWTLWCGALLSVAMHWPTGLVAICLLFWLQAIPESGTVPMMDTTIVSRFGSLRYGRFRLWGSLGYGVSVAVFGLLVLSMPPDAAGNWALHVAPVLYMGAALFVFGVPDVRISGPSDAPATWRLPRTPRWLLFLVLCWLHWVAVMSYNIYLSLLTSGRGFSSAAPGLAVGLAIAGEVVALALAGLLFKRVRSDLVLAGSIAISVVRWAATASATEAWQVVALQSLHFASFGLWYAAVMRELDLFSAQTPRPVLQSVFAASVFGLGSLFAGTVGGALVERTGPEMAFWFAACADLAALTVWLVRQRFAPPPVA